MKLISALFCAATLLGTTAMADKPSLSLVIDDLGYALGPAEQVLALPGDHTYAILPSATYSLQIAEIAHQQGREIILHMPMQSSADLVMEPGALHEAMTETEITEQVARMLHLIPHISGINNHMGSKLTRYDYIMRPIMETIHQYTRPLYFLDSRTTALSTAYQQARHAGLKSISRDIFIDYEPESMESMHYQIERWKRKAYQNGHAVAIGHPYRKTIDLLKEKLPELTEEFRMISISQLIRQQQEAPRWQRYLSHLQTDSKNSKPSP